MKEFKYSFPILSESEKFNCQVTIEPDYIYEPEINEFTDEIISEYTKLKFSIYPEDILLSSVNFNTSLPNELGEPIKRFRKDFGIHDKCGFLMMKFENSKIQNKTVEIIKSEFEKKGIQILRADDKWYDDDLFTNIKTYMHGCSFGIGLFERINSNYFNPNVSLEIGYMMALNKPILFLKDSTLDSLHTDLVGKLYYEYDFQNLEISLPLVIERWIKNKEIE